MPATEWSKRWRRSSLSFKGGGVGLKALFDEIRAGLALVMEKRGLSQVDYAVGPSRQGFGDASSNVAFLLANKLGQRPHQVADELANMYRKLPSTLVQSVEAHRSGYLNFFANSLKLHKLILTESIKDSYGEGDLGAGVILAVEHTSVNPNKALHIGHVRNVVVGDTVARMLRKVGYSVRVLNYVDDSGLQVADIIVGFTCLGFPMEPPNGERFDHYCGSTVYVKTTSKYEEDPSLQKERVRIMHEIEKAGSEVSELARRVTRRVLRCQLETCWRLGARYNCLNFESQIIHSGLWQKIFEKMCKMKLTRLEGDGKNSGCWVVQSDDEDKVLVRSNGTATYIAKDIPYAAWKLGVVADPFRYTVYEVEQPDTVLWQTTLNEGKSRQKFAAERAVTVIDSRQSRLQRIIVDLISQLAPSSRSYAHLAYESVTLSPATAHQLGASSHGRNVQMSGRTGLFVDADSVMDLLESRATEEILKRNPDWSMEDVADIARDLTVGAIRYEMIKQDLDKMITFDTAKSLSLEGDTATYIQYTYARASRILERAGARPDFTVEFGSLDGQYEEGLLRLLGLFPFAVEDAVKNLAPKSVARYCHGLAVAFNAFYERVRVIDPSNAEVTNQRLCLVSSFRSVMRKGLSLLGIPTPDRM